jgi:PAS domain S-box-containing protein
MEKKTIETFDKYKLITENLNDMIYILNEKFEFEYINEPVFKKIMGHTMDDLIGHSTVGFIHPEDLGVAIKILKNGFNKAELTEDKAELRVKDKSGKYHWIEAKGKTFLDRDNKKKAIIIARDITERKNFTQKLIDSEKKYKKLVETSPNSIILLDSKGVIVDCNQIAEFMLNLSRKEIVNKHYLEIYIIPEDKKSWAFKTFQKVLKDGTTKPIEMDFINKKGEKICFEAYISLLTMENETFIQVVSQDITDRKNIEQKLKESEEKYRLIAENIGDLVSVFNKDLKLEYINEGYEKLSGYSLNEIINRNPLEFIHNQDKKKYKVLIKELFKTGLSHGELRFGRKNGSYIWLELLAKKYEKVNGESKYVVVSRNINDRKLAEKRLKESEENYREAYDSAKFYKDIIAHDMNNILQNIKSSAELCLIFQNKHETTKKFNEMLDIIQDSVNRGANLISNVHKLSQIENMEITLELTEVCKVIKDSLEFFHKCFQDKKINVKIDTINKTFFVNANELLLDVFENILNNAVKHNENPIIEIFIKISKEKEQDKNYIMIEFIDNGIGIPDDDKKVIFNRDYKRNKSIKGMGIGLSLVKKIIENYGGKIWIENRVSGDHSKGSNFILCLPESS